MNFLPESRRFSIPNNAPWLLSFCFEGSVYYNGIWEDMMPVTKRIAIVRPGVCRELLDGCGIKFFCTVDDDYNLEVTEQVEDDEVWNGVPITR